MISSEGMKTTMFSRNISEPTAVAPPVWMRSVIQRSTVAAYARALPREATFSFDASLSAQNESRSTGSLREVYRVDEKVCRANEQVCRAEERVFHGEEQVCRAEERVSHVNDGVCRAEIERCRVNDEVCRIINPDG